MCGIVGYLGHREPKEVILKGLRALEYRGYDSAGVAILDHGHFRRVRAEGKLAQLDIKLKTENFDGHLGIGHTRWATHGVPSVRNAHPHVAGGVSLVHNGIIENYADLKKDLAKEGAIFESETDSELIAHLIEKEIRVTKDLLRAVQAVVPKLFGAFAVVVVWEGQPDTMVAFKFGPPLILGRGKDELIVASDVQALIEQTREVLYLEDGEIVCIRNGKYELFDEKGVLVNRKPVHVEWNAERASKAGYPHFMLKEIYEQPRAVAQAVKPHIDLIKERLNFAPESNFSPQEVQKILAETERVFVVGCGSAFYSGVVGEYMIERLARLPVECEIASELRYRGPIFPKNSILISVSQSGETADTLAAVRMAKAEGVTVMSVCNVKNSSIDREADLHVYMNSGPEIGVASTKAFSSTIAVMGVLALAFGKAKGQLTDQDEAKYVRELLDAPAHMEQVLSLDKFFNDAAESLKSFKGFLYLGRGIHYPIALEGALKLKELAYMHAEGYPAGEMKHGPLALIDDRMAVVMLAPKDELFEKTLSNLEEAKARGGQIISIGTGVQPRLEELSQHYLQLPEASWFVLPLLEVLPLQLLAYHVADSLGHDVDQPRNLAKSVTVE
jgi:glucosamine--fructose-6-phosphate aminotransferase (isomerizing)